MRKATIRNPGYEHEQIWLPASEQLMEWGKDFHDMLLGDELRMTAFRAAIDDVVRPGSTVLDLGTGTGILAEWALRAGAQTVYAIELNKSLLDVAVTRINTTGFTDRFHPICGLSFNVEIPTPVDIIISETMGNIADNEGFVEILKDARQRFLSASGVVIPRRVESYLVPVEAERAHAHVRHASPHGGISQEELAQQLRRRKAKSPFDFYYDTIIPAACHLSQPKLVRRYEFKEDETGAYTVPLIYTADRSGLLTGFKGYFIATLSRTVTLDISGDDIEGGTTSDSWKHCYFPLENPCPVLAEDEIKLIFTRSQPIGDTDPFRQSYCWRGSVISDGKTVSQFLQKTTSAP